MKIKTTTAFLLLLTFGYGTQAQKPLRSAREFPDKVPVLHSTHDPAQKSRIHSGQISPFRLKAEIRNPGTHENISHRLKAEPVTAKYTEKLDSLHILYYDTISKTFYNEGMEYYFYDTKGRNYSYWSRYFNVQYQAIIPDEKTDVTYSGDYISSETNSYWNVSSGKWEPSYRQTYTYDAGGNQIVKQYDYYDTYGMQW